MAYLGVDTSNYTTSVALFDEKSCTVKQAKKLLDVKSGHRGLRQSEAVFSHTKQLPELFKALFSQKNDITAVCASTQPRLCEDSYMPCFLVGKTAAECVSLSCGVNFYTTSHQHGHILAALYGCGKLELIDEPFIAFHISGGTTEAIMVTPDKDNIIDCRLIASSSDLKAGQAIDRVGVMLGMNFPCGKELDELSKKSDKNYRIKPSVKGTDCSLSGVENKCKKMLSDGEKSEDIALFCLEYITASVEQMTRSILNEYGNLPVLYAGGVTSNSLLRKRIKEQFGGLFPPPEYSCDNAVGVAIAGWLKDKKKRNDKCQQF